MHAYTGKLDVYERCAIGNRVRTRKCENENCSVRESTSTKITERMIYIYML